MGLFAFTFTIVAGTCPAAQAGYLHGGIEQKDTEPYKEARSLSDQEDTETYEKARKLYRDGQEALSRYQYKTAVKYFREVHERYESSKFAADALYWQAFALYRLGTKSALEDARRALELQKEAYRDADTSDDASALYYRVLEKLAGKGDSQAAQRLMGLADDEFEKQEQGEDKYDHETKMAALQALINMNPEKAVPFLKKILKDKDPHNAEMREQALFLLSQHGGDESAELLMDIARNDPDANVRKQAVFWLSQAHSEEATDFLLEILEETDDPEVKEQAIFALAQHGGDRAHRILEKIAQDEDTPRETRQNAIFWLGQSGGPDEIDFLKDLFGRIDEKELKENIIFAVCQNSKGENSRWLMDIVLDEKESIDTRKSALFWAGQQGHINLDKLRELYKTLPSMEVREQVIFVLSQRHERKALDIMMDLAREERNPELRKQLVFWIGQSGDARAEDFLLEIIND